MKTLYELFWNSSLEELERGYTFSGDEAHYVCLVCGKVYEEGIIYETKMGLLTAERAMNHHIRKEHGDMLKYLLEMDKKYTGLSEIQTDIIRYFSSGLKDSEIAQIMEISNSTVRNHRFRLKERAKQAKVFLALYDLLEDRTEIEEKMIDIHRSAVQVDERFAITEKEREKCLKSTFAKDGKLLRFPTKEKEKLIVLFEIVKHFDVNRIYTEREINDIIKESFDDFPLIRRWLIQYGFIDRKPDGSAYWVKA